MTTTTLKLFEPTLSQASQGFRLQLYKVNCFPGMDTPFDCLQEFYISEKVLSMDFLRTKLVAGTSHHDFEIVDVQTLDAQPLLDPSTARPKVKSNKCLAVLRVDREFLLCYNGMMRVTFKHCYS